MRPNPLLLSLLALLAVPARPFAAEPPAATDTGALIAELETLQATAARQADRCSADVPALEALLVNYRGRTGLFPGEAAALAEKTARVAEGSRPHAEAWAAVAARLEALKAAERGVAGQGRHRALEKVLDAQRAAWDLEACVQRLANLADEGRALASKGAVP